MSNGDASLDELGRRFGTDKSSSLHDYLAFYERFFARFRNQPITLLEIGVLQGSSIAVWEAYFPHASIVGMDINPRVANLARPRVAIEIFDQSNIEELVGLGVKHGPFDIIIEDGSHQWEHQITTLRTLFPFLRNGGLYIVEDLQTNYGAMAASYRGISSVSCIEYLKRLVDLRVADDQLDIDQQEDAFLRTYGRAMHFIAFYRRACLIEKSYRGQDRRAHFDQPSVAIDGDAAFVPIPLLVHIGWEGDVLARAGWARGTGDRNNVQGFCIERPEGAAAGPAIELFYRARLHDLTWTEWVGFGEFVGTRGERHDLTGFSVRLADRCRAAFRLETVGEFTGEPGPRLVSQGEDCIPHVTTSGPLHGMQLLLRRTIS